MFGKVKISKTEQKLLLFATLIIPVSLIALILSSFIEGVYSFLFLPQSKLAIDDWSQKPTFPIIKITVFLNLAISSFFIFREKIYASLITFILPVLGIIPVVIFIHQRVEEILQTVDDAETLKYYGETSFITLFLNSLDITNITILGFVAFLIIWQILILWRFLIWKSRNGLVLK